MAIPRYTRTYIALLGIAAAVSSMTIHAQQSFEIRYQMEGMKPRIEWQLPTALPDAMASEPYQYTVPLPSGVPITRWEVNGLPGWLSFDANTRTFSGMPTASDSGTITFSVLAENQYDQDQKSYQVEVDPGITFASHTFTHCGQAGRFGPSLAQCRSAYNGAEILSSEYNFAVSGGIQQWTVPVDGTYRIEAAGAAGAHGSSGAGKGGKGALIKGDFELKENDVVNIAVGQAGVGGSDSNTRPDPGGGGGSFVYINSPPAAPLLVAGGGAGVNNKFGNGANGQANGNAGLASASSTSRTGLPGQTIAVGEGSWTTSYRYQCSGGGAGWLSQGSDSGRQGKVSSTPVKSGSSNCGGSGLYGRDLRAGIPLAGGYGSCSVGRDDGHVGGFGGGGGGGCSGEGGGGGYTGGAGTYARNNHGGGAGSFNAGTNQLNQAGANTGHGYVTITYLDGNP